MMRRWTRQVVTCFGEFSGKNKDLNFFFVCVKDANCKDCFYVVFYHYLGGVSMNYPSHFVLVPVLENPSGIKNNEGTFCQYHIV